MRASERFKRDLRGMMAGDQGLYHRGVLMIARINDPSLDEIARLLWNLALLGYVILIQKRDNEGIMNYKYHIRERITRERIEEAERLI